MLLALTQVEVLQAYRSAQALRLKKVIDPVTGKTYGKKGMPACCREIEEKYNLRHCSISKTTMTRWLKKGVDHVKCVRGSGRPPMLPPDIEENITRLMLACDDRGDEAQGPLLARRALGVYLSGTTYEKSFREAYPGAWNEERGVLVPGKKWMNNWYKRMQQNPEYEDLYLARGRAIDDRKIRLVDVIGYSIHVHTYAHSRTHAYTHRRYYTTDNIVSFYDSAKKLLVDTWKIAVPGTSPAEEVVYTVDRNRWSAWWWWCSRWSAWWW